MSSLAASRPLAANEWVVLRYRALAAEPAHAGACNLPDPTTGQLPFDVAIMTGKNAPNIGRALFDAAD
jgi:hypothetical protein